MVFISVLKAVIQGKDVHAGINMDDNEGDNNKNVTLM